MTNHRREQIALRMEAMHRRANTQNIIDCLGKYQFTLLTDDVLVWAVARLRKREPTFSARVDFHVPQVKIAIDFIRSCENSVFFKQCCIYHPKIEEYPGVLIDTNDFIVALNENPFFFSHDGIIVSNLHFTTFVFLDYDGIDLLVDGVDISVIGLAPPALSQLLVAYASLNNVLP